MSTPTIAAIVRKLHAAELVHLRQVTTDQQALIDAQAAEIERLQAEAFYKDRQADMLQDMVNELQDALPGVRVGLTKEGDVGVIGTQLAPHQGAHLAAGLQHFLMHGAGKALGAITASRALSELGTGLADQTPALLRSTKEALKSMGWKMVRHRDGIHYVRPIKAGKGGAA